MSKPIPGIKINNFWDLLRLLRSVRKDLLGTLKAWMQQFGPTFAIHVKNGMEVQTSDPAIAYEVLVKQSAIFIKDNDYTDPKRGLARFFGSGLLTSNGDFWKRQRKLVAPSLHTKRIDSYAQAIVDFTQEQIAPWHDGSILQVTQEMNALTMRIIAKTMFNTDVRADMDTMRGALQQVQTYFISSQLDVLPPWLPLPREFRAKQARRELDSFVYRTIDTWRIKKQDNGDLLSMLLLAEDEDGNPMTDEQARDEVLTLFLAGFETTANTLNWTWTLLSQNPEVRAKLQQELDTVLGGKLPTLADLRRLPYTEMVIKESMRLYPPAYNYSRKASQDTEVGGFEIPKGTKIGIHTYLMHHRADLWERAEEFVPERWLPANEDKIAHYAYLPFGGGPRVCIGNALAMMEASLILATIASRYELHLAPQQTVEMFPAITLNPKGTLPMTVTQRVVEPQLAPVALA